MIEDNSIVAENKEEAEITNQPLPIVEINSAKEIRDVLDSESLAIVNNIVNVKDNKDYLAQLDKFNLNMSKKNLLRILRMNELFDIVSDEAIERVSKHPDELTTLEIISYLKTSQDAITNSKKAEVAETASPITLNQQNNTVNVTVNTEEGITDRRSKEKVMDAVSKLLNLSLQNLNAENNSIIIDEQDTIVEEAEQQQAQGENK